MKFLRKIKGLLDKHPYQIRQRKTTEYWLINQILITYTLCGAGFWGYAAS
jgi:hypothetical protein